MSRAHSRDEVRFDGEAPFSEEHPEAFATWFDLFQRYNPGSDSEGDRLYGPCEEEYAMLAEAMLRHLAKGSRDAAMVASDARKFVELVEQLRARDRAESPWLQR